MSRSSTILLRTSMSALLLGSVSAPTLASAATAEATAAAPAADTADSEGMAAIVVTATKRETDLQETPISMAVVDTQALENRHVQSMYDFADGAVPSLRVATFEARQSALTIGIRGIVPLDANQPAREQGVGIYVDGVYMGRQHGLNAALFDIERVEVLKGPQGTLFGRNTEGGALSIVSKAPTGEWGGRIEAGAGNYGSRTADFHLDLPKVAGFSVKLDGVIQHQDATTENPLAGQVGWNYYNRKGARAAVRWQPTDTITNDFAYDVAKDENTPFYSQLLNYNPNNCANGTQASQPACTLPGTAYTNLTGGPVKPLLPGVVVNGDTRMGQADIGVPQQVSVDKTHGFTNTLKWNLGDELELRSITAWRGVDATQWDNSGGAHRPPLVNPPLGSTAAGCTTAAPCAFSRYSLADLRQRQFSQELQAVGTVGSIDYVAGLFYFNEHVSDDAATPSSMGAVAIRDGAGVITGYNYAPIPFCTASTPAFVGKAVNGCSIDRASEVWSKSYAAYGQLTWNATDALHITVGGRYTHDEKKGVLHYSRNVNYDTATAAFLTGVGYQPLDATWNRFNPMATIAYDVSNDLHVYAKYATGYRAGGASSRTSNYQAFDPEDVKSYEVGLKSDFWNNRARFNLAGYIMDRKDSQVDISSIQFVGNTSFNNLVTINAPGTTKIRGIEADLTLNPIEGLTLNASYAYTYTKIPPVFINATGVYQNFYIVFTPRNAASGSIDYSLPIGSEDTKLKFHFDGNYSQATQAFDQFATKNDSSLIFNGRISLADIGTGGGRNLTLSLWGRNLFNEQHVFRRDPSNSLPAAPTNSTVNGDIKNVLGDYGNFNAPRTYGIEASVKF
ncbi:TonB-dependent receptor [Sphingobium sp. Cam5-1]|uniref:TonB-dependent receptor n=1 Tax=Sphingobium sp. Cam5-1 TaxID=2789327 RepID=UPI0018AD1437|nr:TonB-dependent receptor [Sphingobium sp. Cam5-1]QPI72088.1 TonB-dependent receptor [Sphingobium sp. Cam5-1]